MNTVQANSAPRPLAKGTGIDILKGLLHWRVWGRLGFLEIRRRYRRTVLGPFWSAIGLGMFVAALGSVGTGLWNRPVEEYVPFLAAGFVVWSMVAAILSEASSLYHGEGSKYGQVQLEYSLLAYALLWRNLIAFAHNLSLYVVVCLIFAPHLLQPFALLAIPGLLLVLVNAAWVVLLLGMFALRFRDVSQFVSSVVNIAMFITPVFWLPDSLTGTKKFIFVTLNPLYHLIDVIRAPMLDRMPAKESYIFVLVLALFGWTLTYLVFSKFRKRIAYWS